MAVHVNRAALKLSQSCGDLGRDGILLLRPSLLRGPIPQIECQRRWWLDRGILRRVHYRRQYVPMWQQEAPDCNGQGTALCQHILQLRPEAVEIQ